MISRRELVKSLTLAAGGVASSRIAGWAAPAVPTGSANRNLIFIIADQHSGIALGAAGHPIVRTPRLDELASEGVLFTHTYTAGATCAPSRASMMTGKYVHSHGVRENGISLGDDHLTLGKILERNGFRSSEVSDQTPLRKRHLQRLSELGYTDVVSSIIGSKAKAMIIPTPYRYETGRAGLVLDHTLDAFAIQNALQFLEENKDRRFCLWINLFGSHDPWFAPEPYDTMYRPSDLPLPPYRKGEFENKPAPQRRNWVSTGAEKLTDDQIRTILGHYFGMISHTDMLVGRLLDKVSDLRLKDNTAVVYTADHGDTMGCHRLFTKGFAFYEPAMRIPLIIRGPGEQRRSARIHAAVSGVDMLATVLDLLDLPAEQGLHGTSLMPLSQGASRSVHEQIYSGEGYEGYDRMIMVRTPEWKLTRYDGSSGELYHLRDDPDELNNLIADPRCAEVRKELTADLENWDRSYPRAPLQLPPSLVKEEPARAEKIRRDFEAWKRQTGL
jgi:choline-sulfatase